MITIALTKGSRVLSETVPIFEQAGLGPQEPFSASRKLVFDSVAEGVRLLVIRGEDVPVYVERGVADIGVVGKDTLLEHAGGGYFERLDLGISRCQIMTASLAGAEPVTGGIRVATKFVNIARRYYEARGQQPDLIKLGGAKEVAPVLGLADEIVDIVETGNTLRANGLVQREHVVDISSRVIVNKAALKLKFERIDAIIERLRVASDPMRAAS